MHILRTPWLTYSVTRHTVISCACITVTQTLWHVILIIRHHSPPIYRYTTARNTVISYIVIIVTWMLGISLSHMHVGFLYSCQMDHRSYCMSYCCIYTHVILLHDCFPLLLLILLLVLVIFSLLGMSAVDMRCVASHIYCFLFPVIMLSTKHIFYYRITCIMHCSSTRYAV